MKDITPTSNDAAETKIVGQPKDDPKKSGKGKPAAESEES